MWSYSYNFNTDRHSQMQKANEVYILLGVNDKWAAEIIWIISVHRTNNRVTTNLNRIFLLGSWKIRFLRSLQRYPNPGVWGGKCCKIPDLYVYHELCHG
jgi:hypothetical protein